MLLGRVTQSSSNFRPQMRLPLFLPLGHGKKAAAAKQRSIGFFLFLSWD
jgi:hypothetical protein